MDSKYKNADFTSANNEDSQDLNRELLTPAEIAAVDGDNAEQFAPSNAPIYARANVHAQADAGDCETSVDETPVQAIEADGLVQEEATSNEAPMSETNGLVQAESDSSAPRIFHGKHAKMTARKAFEELDEGLFGKTSKTPGNYAKSIVEVDDVEEKRNEVREGVDMSENQLPQIDQAAHTSVDAGAPLSPHDIEIASNYAANMARFGQGGLQVGTSPRQLKWPGKVLAVFLAVLVGLTSWNTLAIAEARSIFIQDDATSLASSPDEEIIDETDEGEQTPEDEAAQEGGDEAISPEEESSGDETPGDEATDESSEGPEGETPDGESTDEATSDYAEYLPADLVNADQVIPFLSESLTSGTWDSVLNNGSITAKNETLADADKIDADSYLADALAQHFTYSVTPTGALQASDQSFQIDGSSLVLNASLGNLDTLLEGGYLGAADGSDVVALTFTAPYVYRQQLAEGATDEEIEADEANPTYIQTLSREEWLANGGDSNGARVAISASDIPAGWSVWTEHDGKYLKATKQTLAEGLSGSIVLRYEGLQDENGITINETRGRLYADAVMPSLVVTIAGDMPITQELPIYAGYMIQSFTSANGETEDETRKSVYYAAANPQAATVWVNSAEAMADIVTTINCEADPIYMGEGVGYAPYTVTLNAVKGDVYEYGYELRLEDKPNADGLGSFMGEDIVAVDVTDWTDEEIGAIDPANPETYMVADMPTVTVPEPGVAVINFTAPEESTLIAEEPTSRRVLYIAVPYAQDALNLPEGAEWYDATQLTMSLVADVNSELVQEETWDDSASWDDVLDYEDAFIYVAPTTQDVWFYPPAEAVAEEPTDEGEEATDEETAEPETTEPEATDESTETEDTETTDTEATGDETQGEESTDETDTEATDTETEDETTGEDTTDTEATDEETTDTEATDEETEGEDEPEVTEPEEPTTPDPASFLPEGLLEANQVIPSLSSDLMNTEIEGVQNSASAQASGSVDALRASLESRFNYDVLVSGAPKTVATNVYHIGGSALHADVTLGDLTSTLEGGVLGGVDASDAVAFTFTAPYIYATTEPTAPEAETEGETASEAAEGYTQTLSREEWLANGGDANGGRVVIKADAIPEGWTFYTEHDGKYLEATQETLADGLSGTIVMRYTGNEGKLSAESVLPSFDIAIEGTVPEGESYQVTGGYIVQTFTPAADEATEGEEPAEAEEAVYYALIQNTAVGVEVDNAAPAVSLTSETTALTETPTVDEEGGFVPYLIAMQATDGAMDEPTYTVNLSDVTNAEDVLAFDVTGWSEEDITAIDPYDEDTYAEATLATASLSDDGQVQVTYEPEATELAANAEPVSLYLAVPYETEELTLTEDEETYEPVSLENQVAAEGAVDGEEVVFETAPVALTSTFSFAARAATAGPQGIAPTATSNNQGASTIDTMAANDTLSILLGGSSLFSTRSSSAIAPQPSGTVSTKPLNEVQFNPSLVLSGEVGEDLGEQTYLINSSQTPVLSLQLESTLGTTAYFGGYSAYGSTYYGTYDANKGYVKNDRTYCTTTGATMYNSIDEAIAAAKADGYDVANYSADDTGIDDTVVKDSMEYKILSLAFYNKMKDRQGYIDGRTRFLLNVPYMYTTTNDKGSQVTNQTYDYADWKKKTEGYNNDVESDSYGMPKNPTVGHLMAVNFGTNNKTILNYWSVYLRIHPTLYKEDPADKETPAVAISDAYVDICLDEYISGTSQNDKEGLARLFEHYPEYEGINFGQGFTGELVFAWHGGLKSSSPTGYEEQMSLDKLNTKVPNCDLKMLGQIPENGGATLTFGGETYICTNVQGKKLTYITQQVLAIKLPQASTLKLLRVLATITSNVKLPSFVRT